MITTTTPARAAAATHAAAISSTPLPTVRCLTVAGVQCAEVSLTGKHGAGRTMLLDMADWREASETVTPFWIVVRMGGAEYVVSSVKAAADAEHERSKSNLLFLARFIMKPAEGLNVRYANGNRLDLRRGNLLVLDRRAHSSVNGLLNAARSQQRADEHREGIAAVNASILAASGGAN